MAETTTVARPYARAAFEHAQARKGGLKKWSEVLAAAAAAAAVSRLPCLTAVKIGARPMRHDEPVQRGTCLMNATFKAQIRERLLSERAALAAQLAKKTPNPPP